MAAGVLTEERQRPGRLRTLLSLRARLTWRQYTGERGRIVAVLLILIIMLPLTLGLGVASAIGYLRLPEPLPATLLAVVLAGLWVAWIIIPLTAFSLNEGMDMTRLLIYPLSRRELTGAMLLGTLFDPPTYFMLPLFLAIVVGWAASPALLVLVPALLIAYVLMILTSQIVITMLGGVLTSRRFRDVFVAVSAILGMSCYFIQRGFAALISRFVEPDEITSLQLLPSLRWLPPGSMAQAIVSAADGDWGTALLWLGYGLLWLLLLAWVWWQLSTRLITGGGFLLKGRPRARQEERARPRGASRSYGWLPADLQQLMAKELRLIWRTPQRRIGFLQGFLFPLLMGGYALIGSGLPQEVPPWIGLFLPIFALFSAWIAGQNGLGMEGKGLPFVLLTPVSRRRFWLAKGIVLFVLTSAPALLVGLALLAIQPSWQSVAGLLSVPGIVLITLGISNLGSIFFPYPVQTEGRQIRSNARGGCISGLGNGVLMPTVIGLACLPPALFLAGGQLLSTPWLGLVGGLFSLVYGAAIFVWPGVVVAGRLLLQREAELVAATSPLQGG